MGQKRLFDRDEATGITKYWHVNDKGEYVVETVQEVTSVIDGNKREYNDTPDRYGEFNKVARLPLSVYYELKRKGILNDPVAMKRWLNDSDNRAFRTRAGTL